MPLVSQPAAFLLHGVTEFALLRAFWARIFPVFLHTQAVYPSYHVINTSTVSYAFF
jgi:hypothetical protein